MPRLPRRLLKTAHRIDSSLLSLLKPTRSLETAQRELYWIKEHVLAEYKAHTYDVSSRALKCKNSRSSIGKNIINSKDRSSNKSSSNKLIANLVSRRSRGVPLQYVLGTAFFGDLEITCRSGVLIPRWETAEAVSYLVARLLGHGRGLAARRHDMKHDADECFSSDNSTSQIQKRQGRDSRSAMFNELSKKIRVLDLCTGSGCIPLLFAHEINRYNPTCNVDCVGVDISPKALKLAKANAADHARPGLEMRVLRADVLAPLDGRQSALFPSPRPSSNRRLNSEATPQVPGLRTALERNRSTADRTDQKDDSGTAIFPPRFDILISNPPYISRPTFTKTTQRAVRRFEPQLALVPPDDGAMDFYHRLRDAAILVGAQVVLFEVADFEHAIRVVREVFASPSRDEEGSWAGYEIWRDELLSSRMKDQGPEMIDIDGKRVQMFGEGYGRSVVAYRGDGVDWMR